jgi:hypothetical protein
LRLLGVAAGLACVVVALLLLRFVWLRGVLGLSPGTVVRYDGVSVGWGTVDLSGLHVEDAPGTVAFDAPRMQLRGSVGALAGLPGAVSIDLTAPHLRVSPDAARARGVAAAISGLTGWKRWRDGFRLRVWNGSLDVPAAATGASAVRLTGVTGSLALLGDGATYAVDAVCRGDDGASPLHGEATRGVDGRIQHRWIAAALPLAPLFAVLGTAPALVVRAGTLRDVTLTFSSGAADAAAAADLRADAHLDGGDFVLGSSERAVRGLHGQITIVADGIASRLLAGTLGGAPFEVAGELHERNAPAGAWFTDGTSDLRTLVALTSKIAAQDRVRSARVESIAPGVAFAQYATEKPYGPLVVSLATIDPSEATLRLDTVLANDHVTSRGERTSAMGVRTGAVLGINGDYYDIGGTWSPQGVVIRGGELLRTPIERMTLTVHRGNHVTFQEYRLHGFVRSGTREVALTQINNWPAGDVTLMTPEFGRIPPAAGVMLARLQPVDVHAGRFRVTSVGPANALEPEEYALAIGGLVRLPLHAGDAVTLRYGLSPSADDAVAAIGGGPLLLRNGAWYEDPHAPAPDERDVHWAVVAVGRMADDSLMIAQVDGRHPERSIGMTRPDFAELMRGFGVVDAMALDSGGSSTIVARAPGDAAVSLRNHPSDNDGERWVSNGLYVFSSAPPGTLLAKNGALPGSASGSAAQAP